ncbi:MAG TPA: outer membrane protein assembly factor BamD, partial [Chloroflexota bacterium]
MHAHMSRLTRRWLVLLLASAALGTAAAPALAQEVRYDAAAEKLFSSALQSYRTGHYRTAAQLFDSIIARYHDSHRSTAALIMRAKVAYRMNENYEATKAAKALLADFPTTRYRPDAELLLARVLLRIDRTDEAREMILNARRAVPPDAPPR